MKGRRISRAVDCNIITFGNRWTASVLSLFVTATLSCPLKQAPRVFGSAAGDSAHVCMGTLYLGELFLGLAIRAKPLVRVYLL